MITLRGPRKRDRAQTADAPPTRWLWLVGTGLSLFAVHSNHDIALAAWLFPVFLLRYGRLTEPRRAILRIGLSVLTGAVFWLTITGLVFVPPALLGFLLLAVSQTVPFALDRLFAPRLGALLGTLVFPVSRVAVEYLFVALVGFGSYGVLGATQHANLPLLQLASVTGVYGLSFVLAWFASVVNWAWQRGFSWPVIRRTVLVYLGVLAVVLGGGAARLRFTAPTTHTVRVAGVSASREADAATSDALKAVVDRYWEAKAVIAADPERVRAALAHTSDDLIAETARQAAAGAKIVLWPETQAEVLERDRAALVDRVAAIARKYGVYVDLGVALYTGQAPNLRNITMLVTPQGAVAWTYDKMHPTPMEPMTPGPGRVPVADTPYGRLSNVICYDADYPELVRQAADQGANLMLVPANDWSGYEYLHAEKAVFRAVENGFGQVRHSVHGVSTTVDSQGRVLGSANWFTTERQTMVADVPAQPRTATVYSTVGDLFSWLCLAATAVLVALALTRRRPDPGPDATARRVAAPVRSAGPAN